MASGDMLGLLPVMGTMVIDSIAARDDDVVRAGLRRTPQRSRWRLKPARAEAIDRHGARALLGETAEAAQRDAGDVHALLALGQRAAKDHVLDGVGIHFRDSAP